MPVNNLVQATGHEVQGMQGCELLVFTKVFVKYIGGKFLHPATTLHPLGFKGAGLQNPAFIGTQG